MGVHGAGRNTGIGECRKERSRAGNSRPNMGFRRIDNTKRQGGNEKVINEIGSKIKIPPKKNQLNIGEEINTDVECEPAGTISEEQRS